LKSRVDQDPANLPSINLRQLVVPIDLGVIETALFLKSSICSNKRAVEKGLIHAIGGLAEGGKFNQTWIRLRLVGLWYKLNLLLREGLWVAFSISSTSGRRGSGWDIGEYL
jgi:hypothetical protein